jgi:general secretion pathway protein L
MADLLVLRFNDTQADAVEWVSVDQFGGQLGEVSRGDLTTAAADVGGRKVIALVPAFSVLRLFAEIPVRAAAKVLKALPFAMEEQLAEDVEELHFAMGKRGTDDRLPVAVVQREKMEAWLGQVEAAGFDLAGIYSDGDSLGDIPNTTVLLVESDRVLLRDTTGEVAVADLIGLDALLDLWLTRRNSDDEDNAPPPVNMLVYATPDSQEILNPILEQIRPLIETLDVKVLPDGVLPRLASQSAVNPGINLLQGDYARSSNFGAYWPAWKTTVILLAALLVTLVGSKLLEIRSLNSEAEGLDAAIEQAFRYTFPDVKDIRDPRGMLESKLKSLGRNLGDSSGNLFLSTLKTMSAAISGSTRGKAKLQAINYRSGMMELRVLAPDVDTLDKIQKEIVKSGELQAEIQSANPEGEMVLGRLQIKGAEAR